MKKGFRIIAFIMVSVIFFALGTACEASDIKWDTALEKAANEITNMAIMQNTTTEFVRNTYAQDTLISTISKKGNKLMLKSFYENQSSTSFYSIAENQITSYIPFEEHFYYTTTYENQFSNTAVVYQEQGETSSLIIDTTPYAFLVGKSSWFKRTANDFMLKNEYFESYNEHYNSVELDADFSFSIKSLSFKIVGGRVVEHFYDYEYTLNGDTRQNNFKTVFTYGLVVQIDLPEPSSRNGTYAMHILFGFNDEQREFINANVTGDELSDSQVYMQAAQTIGQGGRYLFGEDGVYEEIENALIGLSGEDAIDKFVYYMNIYSDDPSSQTDNNVFFVPQSGSSPYLKEFTQAVRELYDESNTLIGNAFINDNLAYCITEYGVHILMAFNYL